MIYFVIFLVMLLFNIAAYPNSRSRRGLYQLTLVFVFVFAILRWDVGCDFFSYRNQYYGKFSDLGFEGALLTAEPGYTFAIFLLRELDADWKWLNVLSAIVFFGGLNAFARRQPDPLSFLTLCFPALIIGLGMSAIRQAAAAGLVCFAFNAFAEKKRVNFIALILFAGTFHRSAFVFIAMAPFILGSGAKAKLLLGGAGLALLVPLLGSSETAQGYSNAYVNSGLEAAGARYRAIPVFLAGVIFYVYLGNRWKELSPKDFELANLVSIPLMLVLPLVFYSSVAGDRFGYYLMPLAFAILSRAQFLVGRSSAYLAFLAPLAASLVLLGAWLYLSPIVPACYLPYRTWLAVP